VVLKLHTHPVVYQKKIIFILFSFLVAWLFMLGILNVCFGLLVHFVDPQQSIWWHRLSPLIFVSIGLLLLVSLLIKRGRYARSGQNIAACLGAIQIEPQHAEPEARMALELNQAVAAMFVQPAAHLYVLPDELGINALTVGYGPHDVSILLTWGAMQSMDEQELQGVLAFQYQKIIRGDYLEHTHLEVLFAGLLQISQWGSNLMVKGARSKGSGRIHNTSAIYVFLGSSIWLLGSLGVLVSRIFKYFLFIGREARIDRQTCQHIDQQALLKALARIYVHEYGSQLYRIDSEALTQYCFANALTDQSWFRVQSALSKRINSLRPDFRYQPAWKKLKKNISLQHIIEKILLPTKEDILLNQYEVQSWQPALQQLPILRLSPISFSAKDAVRPLSPDIRRNMERPDVLRRAVQTATGSRELIVAIFMIRQYREFVPDDALVSQSMVEALLKLDGRVHIQVFYEALKQIKLMPKIASEQFVLRLMQIVQADGEIGLLDCLLLDRIKHSQGLLESSFPMSRNDCGQALVHVVDALLHVQQINSLSQIVTRKNILRQLLNKKELLKYKHVSDEPLDLNQSIRLLSGLLTRDKLFFLNIAEQCLWSERVISQDELDVLQLLYWRLGFESDEVVQRVFKHSSLLII
jgi:Zn-dependent protease with chaperone function